MDLFEESEPRSETLRVRVTPSELREINALALLSGETMSALVRRAIATELQREEVQNA